MPDAIPTPRILVIAGSARLDSMHRKLARQTVELLQNAGVDATLADLRDFPMPIYDGDLEAGQGIPQAARRLKELVRRHDGFVIASPEYNGSFSALVKNALDWISRPESGEGPLEAFRGKVAALVSASPGPGGGKRGLRHLRELLEMMSVTVISGQLTIARASAAFDGAGRLSHPEDLAGLEQVVAALAQAAASRTENAAA